MNAKKSASNTNGWILCPSKSFPGKFYYFNVQTGEAVWGISDEEKSPFKKDNRCNIQKINTRFHGYPEPSSPPVQVTPPENVTTTPTNIWPNISAPNWQEQTSFQNRSYTQPTPMFGQQTMLPNVEQFMPMSNMVWMPFQWPNPCWPYYEIRKATIDQVTQTSQAEQELFVQAGNTPIFKRFINYESPLYSKDSNNPNKSNNFLSSTPKNSFNSKKELAGNRGSKLVFESPKMEFDNSKMEFDNSKMKFDTYKMELQNSKMEFENSKMEIAESQMKKFESLDSSDLRFLLIAKRKPLKGLKDPVEKKKMKLLLPLPKKKVTFDFTNLNLGKSSGSIESDQFIPKISNTRNSTSDTPVLTPKTNSNYNNTSITYNTHPGINNNGMPIYNMPINLALNNMPVNNNIAKDAITMPRKSTNCLQMSNENGNMANGDVSQNNVINKDVVTIKDVWYVVVDMDVLLDDNGFVNQLLQSDEKYRLLIPHALRSEIEAICIGDCRGQQRVLVARQLSRRMATAHKQYIVEPAPEVDEEGTENTTESILNCCLRAVSQNIYLVLISNDPYLLSRANTLNIQCYKPQQVKNGVLTKPKPKLFEELQKIKIIVDNVNPENVLHQNEEDNFPVDAYKRQLFNHDKQTDKNCDILINITKPKSKMNEDNNIRHNANINLKITNNTESNNSIYLSENTENQYIFSNHSQNINLSNQNFENVFSDNQKSLFNHSNNNNLSIDNSSQNNVKFTAARHRIEKIMCAFNTNPSRNLNSNEIFKIPALPNKKIPINTSTPYQGSVETDQIRSNFKIPRVSLEERLKKFCVKNKMMHNKIITRMDEWICTYTQIMEELLNNVLQNNSECTNRMSVSATNLHELLTCIKMMYDNSMLRDIVELLVELLAKYTCKKGKLKLNTTPNDFMKMVGCGVLLIQKLKYILPTTEVLNEYESLLDILLYNIENDSKDVDPDILRPTAICRSEVQDEQTRLNFTKEPLYIIRYLKKHFKEWSSYDETKDLPKLSQNEEDIKVVRIFGKNINKLKIDSNKCLSYDKTVTDEHTASKRDETNLIRNISINENLDINKTDAIKENQEIINTVSNVTRNFENTNRNFKTTGLKVIRNIQLIDKYEEKIKNKEPLDLDQLDYSEINYNADDLSEKAMDISEISDNNNNIHDQNISNNIYLNSNHNDASRNGDQNTNNNLIHEDIISESNYTDSVIQLEIGNARNDITTANNNYDSLNDNYGSDEYSNDNYARSNNNYANDENYADNNNTQKDDSNDSGFENDSTMAHSLVKTFLNELSGTFKNIYEFVTSFVEELRGEVMCEERMNILHIKASRCLQHMIAIIRQLKCIIKRESFEKTLLKSLLLSAGVEATSDKRVTRYRQIVLKCLEQAQILENALKIIACITLEDLEAISNNADSISSSIKYLNIFE